MDLQTSTLLAKYLRRQASPWRPWSNTNPPAPIVDPHLAGLYRATARDHPHLFSPYHENHATWRFQPHAEASHREVTAVLAATCLPLAKQRELYGHWRSLAGVEAAAASHLLDTAGIDRATWDRERFDTVFDSFSRTVRDSTLATPDIDDMVTAWNQLDQVLADQCSASFRHAKFAYCPLSFESQVKLRSLVGHFPHFEQSYMVNGVDHGHRVGAQTAFELSSSGMTELRGHHREITELGFAVADRLHSFAAAAPSHWQGTGHPIKTHPRHQPQWEHATPPLLRWLSEVGVRPTAKGTRFDRFSYRPADPNLPDTTSSSGRSGPDRTSRRGAATPRPSRTGRKGRRS